MIGGAMHSIYRQGEHWASVLSYDAQSWNQSAHVQKTTGSRESGKWPLNSCLGATTSLYHLTLPPHPRNKTSSSTSCALFSSPHSLPQSGSLYPVPPPFPPQRLSASEEPFYFAVVSPSLDLSKSLPLSVPSVTTDIHSSVSVSLPLCRRRCWAAGSCES